MGMLLNLTFAILRFCIDIAIRLAFSLGVLTAKLLIALARFSFPLILAGTVALVRVIGRLASVAFTRAQTSFEDNAYRAPLSETVHFPLERPTPRLRRRPPPKTYF